MPRKTCFSQGVTKTALNDPHSLGFERAAKTGLKAVIAYLPRSCFWILQTRSLYFVDLLKLLPKN